MTVAFLLSAPAAAIAQQPDATVPPQPQESAAPANGELEQLFTEYQEVHHQLEDIQAQALQDPQLSAEQEELGRQIREAMQQHDPTMSERLARVESLGAEVEAAQQGGDEARLRELMSEAQQIEQHFMTVQQNVLSQPAIAEKLTAFQTRLEQKMGEVNPEAPNLIARFKDLETRIEAALRAGA